MATLCLGLVLVIQLTSGGVTLEKRESGDYSGDVRNKVQMGVKNGECDDGESGLGVDWVDSPLNYTCYHPTTPLLPGPGAAVEECEEVPAGYMPRHFCMDQRLEYNTSLPTHGDHRPIWPKFGEYRFVPPQRWLHNIEHGAVVALYHPCTHPRTVASLRSLVTGCIRKHIITPSTNLPEDRPLALVAWGCRLLMSKVEPEKVKQFIRTRGLKGPEGSYPKEGQYTHELLRLATPPPGSDMEDSNLCPALTM